GQPRREGGHDRQPSEPMETGPAEELRRHRRPSPRYRDSSHFSPARRSRTVPSKDSSAISASPEPSVKLKRLPPVSASLALKSDSKSPLKVETDTEALASPGSVRLTSPWLPPTSTSV